MHKLSDLRFFLLMWADFKKVFSRIAVPTEQLVFISWPSLIFKPKIEVYSPNFFDRFSMRSTVTIDMIDRKKFGMRFAATDAPSAIYH